MSESSQIIVIGELGAPYGVKGQIKLFSSTNPIEAIKEYTPWLIESGTTYIPFQFDSIKQHNQHFVVKPTNYSDPESVRSLTGKKIGVPRERLPELKPEQYYWSDLEGLTVIDMQNKVIGTVSYLMNTGANDILVVNQENKKSRTLIPFIRPDVIRNVDLGSKTIQVDWDVDY